MPDSGQNTNSILLLPPFAEEMNRVRRYITHLSSRLLAAGYTLWIADLSCTGDSTGKFSAARVGEWQEDLTAVIHHICGPDNPINLLGIRGGSLFLPSLATNENVNIAQVCLF